MGVGAAARLVVLGTYAIARGAGPFDAGRRCDPRAFGAAGDGVRDDTAALRAAVAACGHVVLANGTFCSGTVELGSDRVFEVRAGAALVALPNAASGRFYRPEGGYFDRAPRNPAWNQARFQDYGHSNLNDCLLLVRDAVNVTARGRRRKKDARARRSATPSTQNRSPAAA